LDYSHTLGDREVLLAGFRVGYLLKRARRRSIGFVVSQDGLSVSAPRWVSVADIEQALREKASWILRKLAEQRERRRRLESSRIEWRDGATVPFKGGSLVLVLDARIAGARLEASDLGAGPVENAPRWLLHVGLPHSATATQIRDLVQAWLQQEALSFFQLRCAHFSERLGVRMSRLRLSAAQTRWGSASVDGSIRLNWRLIHFSPAVIDYVVAHELAHLKEMNHSAAFWDVVRSVIPDLEDRRAQLRAPVLPPMD
jgi:predicted metal-dependent hydrolase